MKMTLLGYRMRFYYIIVFLLLFCFSCSKLEYQVIERDSNILSQFQHDKPFVIGSGDALNVAVWRHDEISTDAVVTPDGKIFLPLIGEVNAAGFTVDELKQELNKKFADYIAEPHVTITVKEINSLKIYIIGEVSRSGEYKLDKSTDILQAISMAGGFTIYANKNKIDVIRKEGDKKIKIKFNYNEVVKGKNLEQNIILKPGDVIVVSESLW